MIRCTIRRIVRWLKIQRRRDRAASLPFAQQGQDALIGGMAVRAPGARTPLRRAAGGADLPVRAQPDPSVLAATGLSRGNSRLRLDFAVWRYLRWYSLTLFCATALMKATKLGSEANTCASRWVRCRMVRTLLEEIDGVEDRPQAGGLVQFLADALQDARHPVVEKFLGSRGTARTCSLEEVAQG